MIKSSHDDLLRLHVVTVDETQHVNARCNVDGLVDAAVDGLAAEDTSVDVNHLQGGITFVADDPATVAVERKTLILDNVGQCFAAMNTVEEYWNKRVTDVNETVLDIKDHPENYLGNTVPLKILHSSKMRRTLTGIHYLKSYLSYVAATLRYYNLYNMEAIGISEDEVMAFTDNRDRRLEYEAGAPDASDYYVPALNPDSLNTFEEFDLRIDSLKRL